MSVRGDRPVPGVCCPRCSRQVVYNGNHFCEDFGQGCDWALSHGEDGEPIGRIDKRIWREIRAALGLASR